MGQMRKDAKQAPDSGPKMTDEEIFKQVTDYSQGYKPKPTGQAPQSKSKKKVAAAFHEVFHNTPAAVTATMAKKGPDAAQKQRVAIALSKARSAGARIPRGPRGR